MIEQQHPITPPDELVQEWCLQGRNCISKLDALKELATQASQWGYKQRGADIEAKLQKARDEELEACCNWFRASSYGLEDHVSEKLRAAMRPKPPSLKKQALAVVENSAVCDHLSIEHAAILRRALEALDD